MSGGVDYSRVILKNLGPENIYSSRLIYPLEKQINVKYVPLSGQEHILLKDIVPLNQFSPSICPIEKPLKTRTAVQGPPGVRGLTGLPGPPGALIGPSAYNGGTQALITDDYYLSFNVDDWVDVDCDAGDVTIWLPESTPEFYDNTFFVSKYDTSAYVVRVKTILGQQIDASMIEFDLTVPKSFFGFRSCIGGYKAT